MQEILNLKSPFSKSDLNGALALVEELEEMSRDDKINAIESYAVILLLHSIKQQAEKRTTRSWEVSIHNSVRAIQKKQTPTCWGILLEHNRVEGCFRGILSRGP